MIRPGLVSITFRQLPPREIVGLVARAGLDAIEWGGDIHVPHGDIATAHEVRLLTEKAGLQIAGYGSYYRVAASESLPFMAVLTTANALGSPLIRVWAGRYGSAEIDDNYRAAVVGETRRIADAAAGRGIGISFEYQRRTLTDTLDSALALMRAVNHENVRLHWQPRATTFLDDHHQLTSVLPFLSNVHVFHFGPGGSRDRRALAEGEGAWRSYFEAIQGAGCECVALLEFVRDDDPAAFMEDAATLKSLLAEVNDTE